MISKDKFEKLYDFQNIPYSAEKFQNLKGLPLVDYVIQMILKNHSKKICKRLHLMMTM